MNQSKVFEQIYWDYLIKVSNIDLNRVKDRLGLRLDEGEAIIPFYGIPHRISAKGITGNLERRPETSFWLPTSTDRFYPDFAAELQDGRILVVEYKGEDRWSNDDSREKRAVGELWAERSNGKCLFVMPKGKDRAEIEAAVKMPV